MALYNPTQNPVAESAQRSATQQRIEEIISAWHTMALYNPTQKLVAESAQRSAT